MAYLDQSVDLADSRGITRNRLVSSEFDCMRRLSFCKQYIADRRTNLNIDKLHWALYIFFARTPEQA